MTGYHGRAAVCLAIAIGAVLAWGRSVAAGDAPPGQVPEFLKRAEARLRTQFREKLGELDVEFTEIESEVHAGDWPSLDVTARKDGRWVASGNDLNADGRLHGVRISVPNGYRVLIDGNADGEWDHWVEPNLIEDDRNYDGVVDQWQVLAGSELTVEVDLTFTGKVTRRVTSRDGKVLQIEDDRNGDGRPDRRWEPRGTGEDAGYLLLEDADFDGEWDRRREYAGSSLNLVVGGDRIRQLDPEPQGELVREEVDRNNDGTMDTFTVYADGRVLKGWYDWNLDGRVDRWTWYLGGNVLWALDTDVDGVADVWNLRRRDESLLTARDRDGDGRPDKVEIDSGGWDRMAEWMRTGKRKEKAPSRKRMPGPDGIDDE